MKKWTWFVALVAVVVLVTPALATSAADGAEALAEYMCEGLGGVKLHNAWDEGEGEYGVEAECHDGAVMSGSFRCPMCEPL